MKLVELAHFTDSLDEMVDFYKVFLNKDPEAKSDGMAIFMLGEVKLLLHRSYDPADGELPPEDHRAFLVKSVDEKCMELETTTFLLIAFRASRRPIRELFPEK